jgi:hypothetical protein
MWRVEKDQKGRQTCHEVRENRKSRGAIGKDERDMDKSTMKNLYATKIETLSTFVTGEHGSNSREVFEALLLWERNTVKRQIPLKTNESRDGHEMSTGLFRMPRNMEIRNEGHG